MERLTVLKAVMSSTVRKLPALKKNFNAEMDNALASRGVAVN